MFRLLKQFFFQTSAEVLMRKKQFLRFSRPSGYKVLMIISENFGS